MRIDQTPATGRADRVPVGRPGTMRDPGRSPVDVLIENLSETGALLKTDGTLPVGTLVSLGIPGAGMQFARITRLLTGAMAAEFMVPLDAKAVIRARSADTLVSVAFPQIERGATAPAATPGRAVIETPADLTPRLGAGTPNRMMPDTTGPAGRVPSAAEIESIAQQLRAVAGTDPALATLLRQPPEAPSLRPSAGTWLLILSVLIAGLVCLLL